MYLYLYILIITVITFILCVSSLSSINMAISSMTENFNDISPNVHFVYDNKDNLKYYSEKPPHKVGEYSCYNKECPDDLQNSVNFNNNTFCWKCNSLIDVPQNNF